MGRSVGYEPDGITVYIDCTDMQDEWEWKDFLDNVRYAVCDKYTSMFEDEGWRGREGHVIARNDHAALVVYEYCGLASVNIVADSDQPELAKHWVAQIEAGFRKQMADYFQIMGCIGRANNGEAFYVAAEE
jgi:hypothetical protein